MYDTGTFNHEYSSPGYDEIYTKIGMFKPVTGEKNEFQTKDLKSATTEIIEDYNPGIVSFTINSPQN